MKTAILKSALIAGLAGAAIAGRAHAESPPEDAALALSAMRRPAVQRITATGAGCSDPSAVSAAFSADASRLEIRFGEGQLAASVGPGVPLSEIVTHCRVQLQLSADPGYRFIIQQVSYRGYADMDEGTTAWHSTRYWFRGTRAPARAVGLQGPWNDDYAIDATYGAPVTSVCGARRPLTLDITLGMSNVGDPSGSAEVSLGGPQRGAFYRLSWVKCEG